MLTFQLAAQELRQQLRGPVIRIVALVSLLMVVGTALIDALRVGPMNDLGSGPALVIRVHQIWSLFYLFTAAAFVGEAVTRDVQTGFAAFTRATPVPRPAYLLGRFGGATAALLLCFLTVPLGLLAARLLPGVDVGWVAPVPPSTFALALFALAVPNLLVASALFLALATATRSMNGCLLGAVALLILYGIGADGGAVSAVFEPFAFGAAQALQAGDPQPLIANRALWLIAALLLLLLALWLDARTIKGIVRPKPARPVASASASGQVPLATQVQTRGGGGAAAQQLVARTWHHAAEIMGGPTFRILLLLGLASSLASIWPAVKAQAPVQDLVATLIRSFTLVPVVMVLFFAGELHWSDRTHRIDGIVNATPVPRAVLLGAQVLTLAAILLVLAVVTGLSVPALMLFGGQKPALGPVLSMYVFPKTYDWLLLGVLAWFLQTVSPTKFAGWGYFVLFLIGTLALDQAGVTNPAVHYGRYPGAPLPPSVTGNAGAADYQLGWGILAALMLTLGLTRFTGFRHR